jgi:uncharacterized membrane protein YdjX (TVP38/TMEM64 family)
MPDAPLPRPTTAWRRLVPLAVLVAAGIVFVAVGGHRYLTLTTLTHHRVWLSGLVTRWGIVAALVYIAVYIAAVALSLPGGAILTVVGGFLFGTWLGGLCAVIGATSGSACVFLAARAGLSGMARRAGPFFAKLESGFRADAFNYLLFLRLVPLFPFWLVNLVPAVAGVDLLTFLLATFIGVLPATFVYASLGSGLGKLVDQPDLAVLFHPSVLGPLLGLAVLALIPVWYKQRHRGGNG